MKRMALLAAVAFVVFTAAQPASGQGEKPGGRISLDLRLGSLWEQGTSLVSRDNTHFSIGGRASVYLSQKPVLQRFSLQFALDKAPVSKTNIVDPILGAPARMRQDFWVLNPALGFDVLQTSKFDFAVRYGGAGVANRRTLQLLTAYGMYQGVCDVEGFEGFCQSDWNFLGNAGASIRIFPWNGLPFYFGGDYTRFAGRKNQLVGTLGLSL